MPTHSVFFATSLTEAELLSRIESAASETSLVLSSPEKQRTIQEISVLELERCEAFLGVLGAEFDAPLALGWKRAVERKIPRALLVSDAAALSPASKRLLDQVQQDPSTTLRRASTAADLAAGAEDLLLSLGDTLQKFAAMEASARAEAQRREEERLAAEAAKRAEEQRLVAEAKRLEEDAAKQAEEQRARAEEERLAAEARKADKEKRAAEAAHAEAEKRAAEDAARAEQERLAAEAKKANDARLATEAAQKSLMQPDTLVMAPLPDPTETLPDPALAAAHAETTTETLPTTEVPTTLSLREVAPAEEELTRKFVKTEKAPALAALGLAGHNDLEKTLSESLLPQKRVLLRGEAGVGKTAVARALRTAATARFSDGVIWVDVGSRSRIAIENQIAQALGEEIGTEHDREKRHDMLRNRFVQKNALLILDDCSNKELWPILSMASAKGAVLITARELPKTLATDDLQTIELGKLSVDSAVAAIKALDSKMSKKDAESLAKASDGLPLAFSIAIAHSQKSKKGIHEVISALSAEKNNKIETAAKHALASLSSDEASIFGASWGLPSSSFPAGAAAAAAEISIASEAKKPLENLCELGLLQEIQKGRYQLPSALRALAENQEKAKNASQNAASFYLDFVRSRNDTKLQTLDAVALEHEGILSSARALLAKLRELPVKKKGFFASLFGGGKAKSDERTETAEQIYDLYYNSSSFLNVRGHWNDWKELCQIALEAQTDLSNPTAEGKILLELGTIARLEKDTENAKRLLADAKAKLETAKERTLMAQALHNLALVTLEEKKPKEALNLLDQAIANADDATSATWKRLKAEVEESLKTKK